MKYAIAACLLITICGCRADIDTTDDSHRLEVEVPKVEIGEAPFDADPRTDEDVDVDTPAAGDK